MSDEKKLGYFDMGQIKVPRKIAMNLLSDEIYDELCSLIGKKIYSIIYYEKYKYMRGELFKIVDDVIHQVKVSENGEKIKKIVCDKIRKIIKDGINDDSLYFLHTIICEEISSQSIRRKIIDPNDGLIKKLALKLNIVLNDFKEEKFEQYKLLKMLYSYEKFNIGENKRFDIIDVIANPSLENVYNGKYSNNQHGGKINEIKLELLKEIPPEFDQDAYSKIKIILKEWQDISKILRCQLLVHTTSIHIEKCFENYLHEITIKFNNMIIDSNIASGAFNNQTVNSPLLCVFYLKVLLCEIRGREYDILKINKFINQYPKETSDYTKVMKEKMNILIPLEGIDSYIKENIKNITCLIYKKEICDDKMDKEIKKNIKYVKIALEWCKENDETYLDKGFTLPFIIAAFQEVNEFNKKVVSYGFYQFNTEKRYVISKLQLENRIKTGKTKNKRVNEFYKLLAYNSIICRLINNLTTNNQMKLLLEIERLIDNVICNIFNCNNIDIIFAIHKKYITDANDLIASNSFVCSYLKLVCSNLHSETGFEVYIKEEFISKSAKKVIAYISIQNFVESVIEAIHVCRKNEFISCVQFLQVGPTHCGLLLFLKIDWEMKELEIELIDSKGFERGKMWKY